MSKKSLPFFVPLAVLLFASLACNAITGGGTTSGFQATANAAFTQAASGAATAGAQGSSLEATANAAGTEAIATANAAGGDITGGDSTATPAADQPTEAPTDTTGGTGDGGNPVSGGPQDIPVIGGDNTVLLATDQVVSYESKSDFATVVKFYKDEMPNNGWTQDSTTSVETANATVLAFTKDNRQAQVSITTDPTSQQTVVLITIS